uniref:CUE domain-containing protein n=1 Tax=Trichobilharzia regenti TaxID=157069 RepID=A0AA85KIH5_TRIRE|nr:unnamed protein product [Trichobilharzia regenti]
MSNEDFDVNLLDPTNHEVRASNSSDNLKPSGVTENVSRSKHQEGGLSDSVREQLLLQLDVTRARLVKNYGFLPMSLYCRMRIGDARFETKTASGSGKHPIWNETFWCWLKCYVCRLTSSTRCDNFPSIIIRWYPMNQWYELSGKQGENLEGSINLIFQCRKVPMNAPVLQSTPLYCQPGFGHVGDMRVLPKPISSEDIQAVREIFPSVEDDTIRSLLVTHHGNRELVISELLV